jgi:hypothetical protein
MTPILTKFLILYCLQNYPQTNCYYEIDACYSKYIEIENESESETLLLCIETIEHDNGEVCPTASIS